jgi:hypothetical protein
VQSIARLKVMLRNSVEDFRVATMCPRISRGNTQAIRLKLSLRIKNCAPPELVELEVLG